MTFVGSSLLLLPFRLIFFFSSIFIVMKWHGNWPNNVEIKRQHTFSASIFDICTNMSHNTFDQSLFLTLLLTLTHTLTRCCCSSWTKQNKKKVSIELWREIGCSHFICKTANFNFNSTSNSKVINLEIFDNQTKQIDKWKWLFIVTANKYTR